MVGFFVAFLLVFRSSVSLARYTSGRKCLTTLAAHTLELHRKANFFKDPVSLELNQVQLNRSNVELLADNCAAKLSLETKQTDGQLVATITVDDGKIGFESLLVDIEEKAGTQGRNGADVADGRRKDKSIRVELDGATVVQTECSNRQDIQISDNQSPYVSKIITVTISPIQLDGVKTPDSRSISGIDRVSLKLKSSPVQSSRNECIWELQRRSLQAFHLILLHFRHPDYRNSDYWGGEEVRCTSLLELEEYIRRKKTKSRGQPNGPDNKRSEQVHVPMFMHSKWHAQGGLISTGVQTYLSEENLKKNLNKNIPSNFKRGTDGPMVFSLNKTVLWNLCNTNLFDRSPERNMYPLLTQQELMNLWPMDDAQRIMTSVSQLSQFIFNSVYSPEQKNLHNSCMREMEKDVNKLAKILNDGAEIITTPVPFPYVQMLKVFMLMFLYSVPMALIKPLGAFTTPVVFMLCLGYIGLDEIANEIEDPFGTDDNDLDLEKFSRSVHGTSGELGLVLTKSQDSKNADGNDKEGASLRYTKFKSVLPQAQTVDRYNSMISKMVRKA